MLAEMRQLGLDRTVHEALPRRANHLHIFSVARTEPAPVVGRGWFESGGNRISNVPSSRRHCYVHCGPAVSKRFSIGKRQRRRGDLIITATSIQILTDAGTQSWRRSGSTLTRRANHRHSFIIARILEPAPGNWLRAFESDGSRIFGACHSSHVSSSSQDASRRAAVRTFKIGMICSENRFPLFRS
jgi:hypothetical protein